jgi:hypothetical protein
MKLLFLLNLLTHSKITWISSGVIRFCRIYHLFYNFSRLSLQREFKFCCGHYCEKVCGLFNFTVCLPLVKALTPHPGALWWSVVGELVRKLTFKSDSWQ